MHLILLFICYFQTNLEGQCKNYELKLIDWEFSYNTLKKKAKLREEELLSLLNEQSLKKSDSAGKIFYKVNVFFKDCIVINNCDKKNM